MVEFHGQFIYYLVWGEKVTQKRYETLKNMYVPTLWSGKESIKLQK